MSDLRGPCHSLGLYSFASRMASGKNICVISYLNCLPPIEKGGRLYSMGRAGVAQLLHVQLVKPN